MQNRGNYHPRQLKAATTAATNSQNKRTNKGKEKANEEKKKWDRPAYRSGGQKKQCNNWPLVAHGRKGTGRKTAFQF